MTAERKIVTEFTNRMVSISNDINALVEDMVRHQMKLQNDELEATRKELQRLNQQEKP